MLHAVASHHRHHRRLMVRRGPPQYCPRWLLAYLAVSAIFWSAAVMACAQVF